MGEGESEFASVDPSSSSPRSSQPLPSWNILSQSHHNSILPKEHTPVEPLEWEQPVFAETPPSAKKFPGSSSSLNHATSTSPNWDLPNLSSLSFHQYPKLGGVGFEGAAKTSSSRPHSIFSNQVLTAPPSSSALPTSFEGPHRSFLAPKPSSSEIAAATDEGCNNDGNRSNSKSLRDCRRKRRIRAANPDVPPLGQSLEPERSLLSPLPPAYLQSASSSSPPPTPLESGPTMTPNFKAAPTRSTQGRTTFRPPHSTLEYNTPPSVFIDDLSPERQKEIQQFYKNYNATEGLVTAIVLGGFFVFVSLLVIYKTKCKPMWKNRRKRLTNTPATHSNGDNENSFCTVPPNPPLINGEPPSSEGEDDQEYELGDQGEDEGCMDDEDFEYECIPLKSVYARGGRKAEGDDDEDEDVYFLDEYGNYVFPISTPVSNMSACDVVGGVMGMGLTTSGYCACGPPGDDDEELRSAILRRQSQGSGISNAYTVKSLPGASYLYIPVLDARSISTNSVGRSLSDPEIHFSPPFNHPIILTVNPSSDSGGTSLMGGNYAQLPQVYHGLHPNNRQVYPRHHPKLQQRSHSIQPDGSTTIASDMIPPGPQRLLPSHPQNSSGDIDNDLIAIQIIQPTPNISPTCSLRSFSGDGNSPEALLSQGRALESLVTSSLSPTSSLKKSSLSKPQTDRRVSFSEDSIDDPGGVGGGSSSFTPSRSSMGSPAPSQHLIPCMNYLQVPGQPPAMSFVVPSLSPEAHMAQTSPQARKRRATRLMKVGSFCSINSDADSEIFGPTGELLPSSNPRKKKQLTSSGDSSDFDHERAQPSFVHSDYDGLSRRASSQSKSVFDPLSEYSEFQDDCCSDISELFMHRNDEGEKQLQAQGTFSDHGSLKSLSLDEDDDVTAKESLQYKENVKHQANLSPTKLHNPEYDQIMQRQALLATEETDAANDADDDGDYSSSSCSLSMSSDGQRSHRITVPVTIEAPPPEMRHAHLSFDCHSSACPEPELRGVVEPGPHSLQERTAFVHQETLHTDSGLDTEDIAPASPPNMFLGNAPTPDEMSTFEENVRLVLVRDIGIQVCGDSPNLNLGRRFPPHHPAYRRSASGDKPMVVAPPPTREPSRENNSSSPSASKDFAPEILF
ncbi:hypothetical protein TCAL_02563 [Tigriopus californicus]|uniref:Uncharacterized protein n=1 Tax=Tigriopus californicus TaxID=6832 RepID=A0A553P6C2_TIGCA|nr:uncharacterized protein LOC131878414 [Tigriopus californicus]TRY73236.1 hypothetical protein TCAL_02563 [Tigriopus californicus]